MVLQRAPTECYIEVCEDVICSVKKLGEEVGRLKDLVLEVGVCVRLLNNSYEFLMQPQM